MDPIDIQNAIHAKSLTKPKQIRAVGCVQLETIEAQHQVAVADIASEFLRC